MQRTNLIEIEDITRRELISGALAAALLVACGDEDESRQGREVADAFGTVSVPVRPERVIAVRHHHIGNMLALDVVPAGIVPDAADFPLPEHQKLLAGVPNVRSEADWMLDIEKVMSLKPDLIIEMSGNDGDPWNEEICQLASKAAATVCFNYGYTRDADIRQNMIDVAEALGLQERGADVLRQYDERIAALRNRAAAFGDRKVASFIWTSFSQEGFFVPVDRPSNLVLRTLGIKEPDWQASPDLGEVTLSFENLRMLNDAYAVIVMVEGQASRQDLESNPLWSFLDPVKAGKVIFVDGDVWGWDYLPALMQMLDDVEQKLLPLA